MGEVSYFFKAHAFAVTSIIIFFILIMALGYTYLFAQHAFLKQGRENYKNSYQYSESKNTELINFVQSYNQLETQKQKLVITNSTDNAHVIQSIEIQQAGISDQIYTGVDLVPDKSKLPDSVRQFLIDHPRR
jgi:predicted PurR-regulated permease PerM